MANDYNLTSTWAEVDAAAQGYKNGIPENNLSAGVKAKLLPAGGWVEDQLSEEVQTKLNASGGGGAESLPELGGGFGTCASALSAAEKIVQINGFTRTQGVPFIVKFTNGAKNGDTLNVRSSSSTSSGTGAASLYYNGAAIPNGLIGAGAVATLYYDGTNYSVLSVDGVDDGFGVCSGNGTARTVTITGLSVKTGTRISVRFDTYDVPASATLNVNSYGAKAIRKDGAAIAAGVISAGDVATFVYDGTYWQLVGVMPANPAGGSDSNVFITMTRSGSTVIASKTASQIYNMVTDNQANVVLIDELGRQCDLCGKPASGSGQFSAAKFYTLDEANAAIIVYSIADITGEVTSESMSIYSKGPDGIPQTDLAKETVTITAVSGTPVTYTSSKTFSEISAAKTAGKEIEVVFNGFKGQCIDVGQNAATFEVIDATSPSAPVQYIFVVSGTGCAGAASAWGGSGGGAEIFDVTITTSPAASTKTAAQIYAAKQAGKIIRAKIDGNDATLLAQSFTNEAIFYSIETDSGRILMAVTVTDSNNTTTVTSVIWPIGNANEPDSVTLTGSTPSIGTVVDNTIYTGGELTSLSIGTWTDGRRFTLIFTSGSTPTSLVWASNHEPVWPPNFDGTPEANTRYEINVVGGYAVVGAWEVSS